MHLFEDHIWNGFQCTMQVVVSWGEQGAESVHVDFNSLNSPIMESQILLLGLKALCKTITLQFHHMLAAVPQSGKSKIHDSIQHIKSRTLYHLFGCCYTYSAQNSAI